MTTFLDTILATIERSPDTVAVRGEDGPLTYRQLGEVSASLAEKIQATAGAAYAPVVLDLPRSAGMIAAGLAVLRSGRGCLPLDRTQPAHHVKTILANAHVCCAVRAGSTDSGLNFDVTPLPAAAGRHENDRPNDLAYVLYTSGSTGEPKGVAMGREPLTWLVDWHSEFESGSEAPQTAQFATQTFDVAWQEILTSLALGGTLHIVPDVVKRDPERLLRFLTDADITRLFLPTAFLQTVADRGRHSLRPEALQHVFVAGSQLRITPEIRSWFTHLETARLHNHYGPTETHVVTTHTLHGDPLQWPDLPAIGRPLPHVEFRIDSAEQSGSAGGELLLGGPCLALGYRDQPGLTAERFVQQDGRRWYRTGDLVRAENGELHCMGRIDRQVKIDGSRVEPGEVEAALLRHPGVRDVHVAASAGAHGGGQLVAYVVAELGAAGASVPETGVRLANPPWKEYLAQLLPAYSVPAVWVQVGELPLNAHGKVDTRRLPVVTGVRPSLAVTYSVPRTATEQAAARVWERHLDVGGIGRDDNFFDLGGTSLHVAAAVVELASTMQTSLSVVDAYANPTVRALAEFLDRRAQEHDGGGVSRVDAPQVRRGAVASPIAVVGLACRLPEANSSAEYWSNLVAGRESITRLDSAPGADGRLRAGGVLKDLELFDADYFGLGGRQAELMDPQHRLFLECCVEALEDASCVPGADVSVGVFGGAGPSTYLLNNLLSGDGVRSLTSSVDDFGLLMANDKEFLAGRASYCLDLRGPAVNVNAACATSLYALHFAVQALQAGECDVALAGAAFVGIPQLLGYEYQEAMPFSPDGRCRVFDRDAAGTVFGSGVGVVALKPLDAALADGDDVYAVVRGSGISNDGAQKVGMTAPSVAGQERAIRQALEASGLPSSTIGYVEAHGTATPMGDAIEVEALRRAYGPLPAGSCAIGSVKGNLGHLGWAAGMAGLLKAVLVLRHGQVPATLHYRRPNPELRLDSSSFTVADRLRALRGADGVARVGVSAFGIGGFNAHVVLESAPGMTPRAASGGSRRLFVLPFSARSEEARDRLLVRHGDEGPAVVPADAAATLGRGRRHHACRASVVVAADGSVPEAVRARRPRGLPGLAAAAGSVVGLFAGHGAERRGLGQELYESEPIFRAALDSFDAVTEAEVGTTVSSLLYALESEDRPVDSVVEVHAVNFAVQWALLRLMESKGVQFDVLLGHSMGQYVAACAAGVFSPADGMYVVIERGRAIEGTAEDGTMASVAADPAVVARLIDSSGVALDIAVVNGERSTVVSGPVDELDRFARAAAAAGVNVRRLGSLRAGHSRLMRPAADRLLRAFRRIPLSAPARTVVCNISGDVAGEEMATPEYWVRHLCQPVQFAAGLLRARELGAGPFFELSGSSGLLSLAGAALPDHPGPWIPVLRARQSSAHALAQALAEAYEAGLNLDWKAVNGVEGRRIHLPSYPFDRRHHWVGPPATRSPSEGSVGDVQVPVYEVRWSVSSPEGQAGGVRGERHVTVLGPRDMWLETVRAAVPAQRQGGPGHDVVVLFENPDVENVPDPVEALRPLTTRVLQAVQDAGAPGEPRLWLVTRGSQQITPEDVAAPLQRAMWGLGKTLAMEQPHLRTVLVDLPTAPTEADLGALGNLLGWGTVENELAVRRGMLHCARLVRSQAQDRSPISLRADHTYLVVGGLTGFGLWTAQRLAERGARHLLLVGRRQPGAAAQEAVAALRSAGVQVETASADVCDAAAVDRLFAERRKGAHPIGGVVHSAGTLDDCLVEKAQWDGMAPVMDAKVRGSWNLHRASVQHEAPLSFFALYSSATAVHGNYGQAAYGAANAFLDGLAQWRAARGLPAVAFSWGVLESAGHVSAHAELMATLRRRGLGVVSSPVAEKALLEHLGGPDAQVMVLPNDWATYLAAHHVNDAPFYRALRRGQEEDVPQRNPESLLDRLVAAPETQRRGVLAAAIASMITHYVDLPEPPLPDARLSDLGLDSLSLMQLRNSLQKAVQRPLPTRLLVTHPTIDHICDLLLSELAESDGQTVSRAVPALSLEQRRWVNLIRNARYGQRVVPIIFHERLDQAAFVPALRTVVERHEVLRQYYPDDVTVVRVGIDEVLPSAGELFRDLSDLGQEACVEAVGRELQRLSDAAPDPSCRPAWTMGCLKLPGERFMVVVVGQHLEFDGSGLSVFVDELREAYREVRDETTTASGLATASVQYGRYTQAQSDYLAGPIERSRPYFTGLFAGVRGVTRLPGADRDGVTRAHPSLRHTPTVPFASVAAVRGVADRLGVTPLSVILSSWAALTAEIVSEPVVCVSVIRSSRYDERYAGTIGPFTMPFPVPVHVAGWIAPDLVRQVDDTLATLSAHPQYPATDLLAHTRAFAGLPLDTYFSDVGINFTSYRRREERADGPRAELIEVIGKVDHPLLQRFDFGSLRRVPGLHLVVTEQGPRLIGNYWYHAHRFTGVRVAAWADRHRAVMKTFLAEAGG